MTSGAPWLHYHLIPCHANSTPWWYTYSIEDVDDALQHIWETESSIKRMHFQSQQGRLMRELYSGIGFMLLFMCLCVFHRKWLAQPLMWQLS
mmetsp:Transcript_19170/g.33892  ORF Transcript_19170/g.33892 Transcript_19170/m.33892 type:complete len:92 (-) Transcript_19170:29-304(-)